MTKTNAIPNNPFTHSDGATILAAVKAGKRNKAFHAACDEIDRRVLNRMADARAFTKPIVEALAILDKRGIVHAGPMAADATVLTQREKDTVAEVMLEARTVSIDGEPVKRVTTDARKEALANAKAEAQRLADENGGKGFVKFHIKTRREALDMLAEAGA